MLVYEGMMFCGSGILRKEYEGILGDWGMLGKNFMLVGWGNNDGLDSIRRLWREDRSWFWLSQDLDVVVWGVSWWEVIGVEMAPDNVVAVDCVDVVRVGWEDLEAG